MQKYVLVLTSSAALLAGSVLAASAQQSDIPSLGEQLAQAEHSPESEDEPGSMMGHNRMGMPYDGTPRHDGRRWHAHHLCPHG